MLEAQGASISSNVKCSDTSKIVYLSLGAILFSLDTKTRITPVEFKC